MFQKSSLKMRALPLTGAGPIAWPCAPQVCLASVCLREGIGSHSNLTLLAGYETLNASAKPSAGTSSFSPLVAERLHD